MRQLIKPALLGTVFLIVSCASQETVVRNPDIREDQVVKTDLAEASDKVCKYTRVIGSQIPKMRCFTPTEIVQLEADAKARLRADGQRGRGSPNLGPKGN